MITVDLDALLDKIDKLLYGRQPKEALKLILSIDVTKLSPQELCDYKTLLGETYSENNMTDKAMRCFQEVLDMKNIEDKDEALCYGQLADLFYDKGEFQKSIECGLKALTIENRRSFLINLYIRLTLSYNELNDYKNAIYSDEELLKKFYPPQDEDERQKILSAYNSLILAYWFLGEEEKCFEYFNRIQNEKGAEEFPSALEDSHTSIGSIYYRKRDYEKAIFHFHKAIDYAKKQGRQDRVIELQKDIDATLNEMNQKKDRMNEDDPKRDKPE